MAGVEIGGTKSIAVLASGKAIVARLRVPTTSPDATLRALSAQLVEWHAATPLTAIGIASFGPLALDPDQTNFGRIMLTPKPTWSDTDVYGYFAARFAIPIALDTDVAGAALAEGAYGAAQGCRDFVYLTVGTGVGAGIVANGHIVHGRVHPEVGHILVRREVGDTFGGACPFHGDCLEGLVSGPALAARTGLAGEAIPDDHPVWNTVAAELAQLMAMLILTLSPERIIVGGGIVIARPKLLPMVRACTVDRLAGYLPGMDHLALERMIRPPDLGDDAGPIGAVRLGEALI